MPSPRHRKVFKKLKTMQGDDIRWDNRKVPQAPDFNKIENATLVAKGDNVQVFNSLKPHFRIPTRILQLQGAYLNQDLPIGTIGTLVWREYRWEFVPEANNV